MTKPKTQTTFVIQLFSGNYYWCPEDRPEVEAVNRWCVSPYAAKKFTTYLEAVCKANTEGLKGFKVTKFGPN